MKLSEVEPGMVVQADIGGVKGIFITLSQGIKNVVNTGSWQVGRIEPDTEVKVLGKVGTITGVMKSAATTLQHRLECDVRVEDAALTWLINAILEQS